jgi:hypothetical protein
MIRAYISGPMTGVDDLNRAMFAAAAVWAAAQGWEPVNPHDVPASHDGDCAPGLRTAAGAPPGELHAYGCFIRADLVVLLTCQVIVMLPDWSWSRGARAEHDVATICGMPVHSYAPASVGV